MLREFADKGKGLTLSRRVEEALIITAPDGTLIRLMVIDLRRDQVRVAVCAPAAYRVDREEVVERRRGETVAANVVARPGRLP